MVVGHGERVNRGPAVCQVAARPLLPMATPPSTSTIAIARVRVSGSPSQTVAVITLTTGVARSPSDAVTAGRLRLAVPGAPDAIAVPTMPRESSRVTDDAL